PVWLEPFDTDLILHTSASRRDLQSGKIERSFHRLIIGSEKVKRQSFGIQKPIHGIARIPTKRKSGNRSSNRQTRRLARLHAPRHYIHSLHRLQRISDVVTEKYVAVNSGGRRSGVQTCERSSIVHLGHFSVGIT